MPLDPNAQICHDTMVSLSQHVVELTAQLSASIITFQNLGATDSAAKATALKDAMASHTQAILDAAATYEEVSNLS